MITISKEELTKLIKDAYIEGSENATSTVCYNNQRDGYYCGGGDDIVHEEEFKGSDSELSIDDFFTEKLYKNFKNF